MLCQRQCQQNYKENGHKIQGVYGQTKDIFKRGYMVKPRTYLKAFYKRMSQ